MSKHFRNLKKLAFSILIAIIIVFALFTAKLLFVNYFYSDNPQFTTGNLKITMIDVQNGDSFLILQNDKAMLVDTGYFTTYSNICKILKEYDVKKLDYVILTHPHHDHEGGLVRLLLDYRVDSLLIQSDFGNLKMSVEDFLFYKYSRFVIWYENLFTNNVLDVPKTLNFADSELVFFSTTQTCIEYSNLNDYSLVFKFTYKNTSILFTGDMQKDAEKALLNSGADLSADVLKVGHHGSYTSSSKEFLDAVNPKYAMLSCIHGINDLYGHPGIALVTYMKVHDIPIYRTDELGNVVLKSDGKDIIFLQEPGDYLSGTQLLNSN